MPQFSTRDDHGQWMQQDANECWTELLRKFQTQLKVEGFKSFSFYSLTLLLCVLNDSRIHSLQIYKLFAVVFFSLLGVFFSRKSLRFTFRKRSKSSKFRSYSVHGRPFPRHNEKFGNRGRTSI